MPAYTREALAEAISKAIELGKGRRFKQSVEMIIVLRDIDVKGQAGKIREFITLPKGRGKERNVCVVADGELANKAREAGAKIVLTSQDLQGLSKKQAKKIASQCDWVLVRTDLMALTGRVLGPALGPRGKAPVPLPASADISALINRYKNTVVARVKDQPQIMVAIGTEDMDPGDLAENALAVLSTIEPKLPSGAGNIAKLVFKTTMGMPVEV